MYDTHHIHDILQQLLSASIYGISRLGGELLAYHKLVDVVNSLVERFAGG